jgi:hypothetical protein
LWIAGLGSLLAVVFSFVARKSIKASQSSQTGAGLATAGLVIGIVGLFGAAPLIALIANYGTAVHQVNAELQVPGTVPTNSRMGASVSVADPGATGITDVAVKSLVFPVIPDPSTPAPNAGEEYAVADVQVCAGPGGSQSGSDTQDYLLEFSGGQSVQIAGIPVKSPDLGTISGLAANACVSGYLSFEITIGASPSYVAYQPGLVHQYRWRIATHRSQVP